MFDIQKIISLIIFFRDSDEDIFQFPIWGSHSMLCCQSQPVTLCSIGLIDSVEHNFIYARSIKISDRIKRLNSSLAVNLDIEIRLLSSWGISCYFSSLNSAKCRHFRFKYIGS